MTDASSFLSDILIEHIGGASVIPFSYSLTLEAMQLFGGYALLEAGIYAVIGLVLGCLLNWILGYALYAARTKVSSNSDNNFAPIERFFHSYGFILAALHFLPLGGIIVLVAGFFKTPIWKVGLAVTIGAAFSMRSYLVA